MNTLDLIIVIVAVAVAARGVASGFLRQAASLGGFVLGLMLGAMLAPALTASLPSSPLRIGLVLFIFFGTAVVMGGLGEAIGHGLSSLAERYSLSALDAILGATFGVGLMLLTVWLLAATFVRSATPGLATQLQGSRILQALDRTLPPAPDVMARLEHAIGAGRFPRVFTGLEPTPAPPVSGPGAAAINVAANAGRTATVKIESAGCGGLVEGSGFVAAPSLVATNAHVVAGITSPVVVDSRGPHRATVVLFDPDLDFAVLRTSGLAAAPLPLAPTNQPRGTVGAVLGYPGGGSLTISPAAILGQRLAIGRNIYDTGLVHRDIYELQTVVRPGNSGGPLVSPNGTVIGVIFATSTVNDSVGYALTSAEVIPDLNQAAISAPVSTGECLAE